ncbi:murein hydrolase activator EnvC family protein [Rhizobium sp. SG2393]|uniref:murein hydrolase activator EnvC family protein n=1 Tax=Rhizobium sp. SG2393 TaxID=3276279 RepID=UPI0036702497
MKRYPAWRRHFALSAGCALVVALVATAGWSQEGTGAPVSGDGPAATLTVPPQTTVTTQADAAADLAGRRDRTRAELQALSQSISISRDRAAELEKSIADLDKTTQTLRAELVASAKRRQDLEQKIVDGEKKLVTLLGQESSVKSSLLARRDVLAEVLAALQRMGRNPPPALLVSPEDALNSVRSAILMGAVVPGLRQETDRLVADLKALTDVRTQIVTERDTMRATMQSAVEEEQRTNLLIAEKAKLRDQNTADLAIEKRRAETLASQATSLDRLIVSLESEISSVRDAADAARQLDAERARQSEAERAAARARAEQAVPDKNRIAPAYAFADLKKKLPLPVAGTLVRKFGDEDGTGHSLQGAIVETSPGALVTAPSDGWVVFAGKFRSYGQTIILNPGDGYHVVLTGMEATNVTQGQFVVAGEPLATMGAKRVASATALALETERPTLYIEFRKDGKPVDSGPWWTAAEPGKARNDS